MTKMVSKRSVYDNLSGLTLGHKQRNPLYIKGFRCLNCGLDGTATLFLTFSIIYLILPPKEVK